MFRHNVGMVDRAIRIGLGIILAAIGMHALQGTASAIVSIVALIPLATGIAGFCPLYVPFKFSTQKTE